MTALASVGTKAENNFCFSKGRTSSSEDNLALASVLSFFEAAVFCK
jgi:hypothetical protein